jgi:[ribosomal protein S5]-alanine N-acetyltransferase
MRRIPGWPATLINPDLHDVPVALRPLRLSDARAFREIRDRNAAWLRSSAQTSPETAPRSSSLDRFRSMVQPGLQLARLMVAPRLGRTLTWVVTYDGRPVGQFTISSIMWGATRSGEFGAWIDQAFAGQGIMGTASALAVDYCFQVAGLHRLEALIRADNVPLRRAMEKYGFREEGVKVGLTHIDGAWRDHVCYAITAEELPKGAMGRWRSVRSANTIPSSADS